MRSKEKLTNTLTEISDLQVISIQEIITSYAPKIAKMLDDKGLSGKYILQETMQDLYLLMIAANEKKIIKNQKAYLFGALRNMIKEKCRERKKYNDMFSDIEDSDLICQKAAAENPFLVAEIKEAEQKKIAHLTAVIETHLKPVPRTVLVKRFFEGKSIRKISEELQIKEDNVRAISSRAIRKVKALIL